MTIPPGRLTLPARPTFMGRGSDRATVLEGESKITGLWTNEDNSMRILIHGLESRFQAEVVWTKDIDDKILGSSIIRNMSLKYFSWGEGTYIDPFTKDQFKIKMKLKDTGRLRFHLFEKSGHSLLKTEEWKQVR